MRITPEAKRATRARIVDSARRLFVERGFEATTTRELAAEAGIAAGTLFNYFASKEALAATLVDEALDGARADFERRRRGDEELAEELFLHVVTGLNRLEPYRSFVGAVLETALSPFARSGVSKLGDELRAKHLEVVAGLLAGSPGSRAASKAGTGRTDETERAALSGFVSLHLYWTLYLGVVAFWAGDESPKQEDTLAVLDESLRVFALSLSPTDDRIPTESDHA